MALLITCNGAAEGVAKINWSVSYPSAFSRRHANTYRKCWEDLCAELRLITGLDHELIEDDGRGGLQTEAIAFANYFRSYRAKQVVHAACLDVGGGTTDVSIWQEDSLLHQVSIPFAGRDICTRIMQMKPVFMRSLFKSSAAGDIANDEAKLRQDPNFNGWFDNCLRYESEILLLERLPVLRAQQDKQLNEFVSLMAIGFAGLYHYLGLILKGLSMEKSLMKQTPMDVYMGGTGARFMHWLDESGRFTKACETDELMEAVQTMSASFTSGRIGNALTTLSNAFKDETACGLVSNGGNLKGDFDPRHHRMFAGERVTINRSTFDIFDRVIEPEDGIVSQYDLVSNDELRRFTRNYDTILKSLQITSLMPISKLATEARLWSDVDTEIRAICLEKMDKEFIELDPEPPFFTGLKGLVRVLAREWAERF
jgi:hypothetical protein